MPRCGRGSLAERGTRGGGRRARQPSGDGPRANSSASRVGDAGWGWRRADVGMRAVGSGRGPDVRPAEWGHGPRDEGWRPVSQLRRLPFSSRGFCDERKLGLPPLQLGAETSRELRSRVPPLQHACRYPCRRCLSFPSPHPSSGCTHPKPALMYYGAFGALNCHHVSNNDSDARLADGASGSRANHCLPISSVVIG